jgi:hypothetical protein
MTQPLFYVDRSKVREGALAQLKTAIIELAEFVEQNEPRLISYTVYFSEEDTEMTVVHVHSDAASLDPTWRSSDLASKSSPTYSRSHRFTSTENRVR